MNARAKQAQKLREKLRSKLRQKLRPELPPSKTETLPKTSLCRNPLPSKKGLSTYETMENPSKTHTGLVGGSSRLSFHCSFWDGLTTTSNHTSQQDFVLHLMSHHIGTYQMPHFNHQIRTPNPTPTPRNFSKSIFCAFSRRSSTGGWDGWWLERPFLGHPDFASFCGKMLCFPGFLPNIGAPQKRPFQPPPIPSPS